MQKMIYHIILIIIMYIARKCIYHQILKKMIIYTESSRKYLQCFDMKRLVI